MRALRRLSVLVVTIALLIPWGSALANHTAAQCLLFGGFTVDGSMPSNPLLNQFQTIQEAVNHLPNPGPCIVTVKPGIYAGGVTINSRNTLAGGEANRIVIQADPTAAPGAVDVTVSGASGFGFSLSQSRFITIRGFEIRGTPAGGGMRGIFLAGGSGANADINIESNHIHDIGGTGTSGAAGVDINVGNLRTWVVNNLIRNIGRNGVVVDRGDPTYLVNNTIVSNGWNGITRNLNSVVYLVNNLIVNNGTSGPGGSGNCQAGLCQTGTGTAPTITLRNNMFYRNGPGATGQRTNVNDIDNDTQTLDPTDSGNYTTNGHANTPTSSTVGIVGCTFADCAATHALTEIFVSLSDFHLRTTPPISPAIDKGTSTCACGVPERVPANDFEGDARPQDGNGDAVATHDIGYDEAAPAVGPPATVVLTPAADTNPVGTNHTVTATVTDATATATPGIIVRFSVSGAVTTTG